MKPLETCPYIDAHSHIWTRDVERFPLATGQTVEDLRPPSFTAEELLATAQPAGVGRVVLIQHHPYHGVDTTYLIDAARRYPGTFRVVAMVDDTQPGADGEMRRLLDHGVTGFRVHPSSQDDSWLETPGMEAMWTCAAETGQSVCCLVDPWHLPGLASMCRRHPDTSVVIDHLARIGTGGVVRDEDVDSLCRLGRCAGVRVKVSAFYALGKKQPPYLDMVPLIRRVYDAFGAKRLMWASDCPYQLAEPHTYSASIALVREHLDFLSEADKEWMLWRTAEQVFFR